MKSVFRVIGSFFLFTPNLLFAGQIGIGDFTAGASIQDFEILGPSTNSYISPLLVGNDTFDGDDHLLRSSSKFGPAIGRTGTALSNDAEKSNASVGFIEVLFGQPILRAGLYAGAQFAWEANVEFYDTESNLLGTISPSGIGGDNAFVAWQADNGFIGRIRVVEVASTRINPLIIVGQRHFDLIVSRKCLDIKGF